MSEVGKLHVSITTDTTGFQQGLRNTEKTLKSTERKLDAAADKFNKFGNIMTIGVTLPIIAAFKGMLDATMDLEATEAKFNTVFKGMTNEADAFIDKFKELTPLTKTQARGVASGIQDLLVPMGFARDEATKLTGAFMPLIGALANFNNATHTAEQVANAVTSALIGEYEPMRRLGVVTNKTAINQRVLAMGLAETEDEITDQMRALALHEIITESSADAIAAYTEENLDAKTKMALMKVEIIDVAAELGKSLIPMIEKAIEWISNLTKYFQGLTTEQQETILKVMAFVAVIGPASKLIAALLGLTKMILGVRTALLGIQTASTIAAGASGLGAVTTAAGGVAGAKGLAGIAPAAMGAAGGVAAAVAIMLAQLALIAAAIYLAIEAWKRLKRLGDSGPIMTPGSGGIGANWDQGKKPTTSPQSTFNNPLVSTTQSKNDVMKSKLNFAGMFDTGGIVPGPRGAAQLALVHGGETILPTHKSGGGGMSNNTIRHEIDLINVPATIDKQSLQAGLTEMLNNPQVKRRFDRMSFENQQSATRGLGQ